jgi:hypothetical protein
MDELQLHALCPCGHEVSWHDPNGGVYGGCRYRGKDNPSKDGSDYCTCPASRHDFEEEAKP